MPALTGWLHEEEFILTHIYHLSQTTSWNTSYLKQTKSDTLNHTEEKVGSSYELKAQKRLSEQNTLNIGTKTIKQGELMKLKSFSPAKDTNLRKNVTV